MTPPRKGKRRRRIGIALMLLAAAGFLFSTQAKSRYQIFGERFAAAGTHTASFAVEPAHSYRIFIWAVDEALGLQEWADMQLQATLTSPSSGLLETESAAASASSGQESGGKRRAQDGFEWLVEAAVAESWNLHLDLREGDYVDVEVYRDLSDLRNLLPGLYVLCFLGGIVLFLRGRNPA